MNQPWGLSGPEFLQLYAGSLALALLIIFAVYQIAKRASSYSRQGGQPLTIYELAYLKGGSQRVADAVIAGMVQSNKLRVGRRGTLSQVYGHRIPYDSYETRALESPRNVTAVRRNFRKAPEVDEIVAALRHKGLVATHGQQANAKTATLLLPALGLVGLARLVNGLVQDYPVGYLVLELLATLVVWGMVASRVAEPFPTRAGSRVVNDHTSYASGARRTAGSSSAVALVALGGLSAYPDTATAKLLQQSANVSAASGDSGGGGSCGGGGGGCGGGGG